MPEGPLRTAALLVYGLCVAVAPFIYTYYLGVLAQGAAPEGSLERQDYDTLRASLAGDNLAARLYADWLTRFPRWVERFFGDAGMADRTLFPRAFGLKKAAPLWTAPAFDRLPASCLDLSHRDDFRHLGHFRPCRSGGGGTRSEARSLGWLRGFGSAGNGRVVVIFMFVVIGCWWSYFAVAR